VSARDLARVDEDHTVLVLDRPAVNRQGIAPRAGHEEIELSPNSGFREQERVLDARRACREGMDPHRSRGL